MSWKQLLKPILKEGSDPHNHILIDSIITEEQFWKGVMDLTETKNTKNEVKEILSIEFLHALGGPEFLGVVWSQFNPSKSLAEADSMEIALFLQSQMNQREQVI